MRRWGVHLGAPCQHSVTLAAAGELRNLGWGGTLAEKGQPPLLTPGPAGQRGPGKIPWRRRQAGQGGRQGFQERLEQSLGCLEDLEKFCRWGGTVKPKLGKYSLNDGTDHFYSVIWSPEGLSEAYKQSPEVIKKMTRLHKTLNNLSLHTPQESQRRLARVQNIANASVVMKMWISGLLTIITKKGWGIIAVH